MESKNVWKKYSKEQVEAAHVFAKDYIDFLNNGKTERECIDTIVNLIEKEGYLELEQIIKNGGSVKEGDKVYSVWMNKCIVMYQIGKKDIMEVLVFQVLLHFQ